MKNSALQSFRLFVALLGGILCLAAAGAYRFDTLQFNAPLARFAIAGFGLAWFAQALFLRNQIRAARG
jgi:hypothetical protein